MNYKMNLNSATSVASKTAIGKFLKYFEVQFYKVMSLQLMKFLR